MNEQKELREQLQLMMQKAFRSIRVARQHVEEGNYDFASSRAYYAAFYAMQAVLLTKNLSFSKHAGVISAFNRHFVRTAVFPKEFSKLISQLFRERQTGDYEFDLSIGEDDARQDTQIAERVLQAIATYLIQEGFLQAGDSSGEGEEQTA
jgi:uncharacterized protein (UPF0332 family)